MTRYSTYPRTKASEQGAVSTGPNAVDRGMSLPSPSSHSYKKSTSQSSTNGSVTNGSSTTLSKPDSTRTRTDLLRSLTRRAKERQSRFLASDEKQAEQDRAKEGGKGTAGAKSMDDSHTEPLPLLKPLPGSGSGPRSAVVSPEMWANMSYLSLNRTAAATPTPSESIMLGTPNTTFLLEGSTLAPPMTPPRSPLRARGGAAGLPLGTGMAVAMGVEV
ncbi:hypothetical protein KEM52_002049 [Ascosphaera acerosa]|nr:hypothetical protein KEM52_002049 [Ascosphaera acerosa]